MPPSRPRYTVFYTDSTGDTAECDVTVTWGDQLRAETMTERLGITNKMGAHLATLWAWCALVRMKLYAGDFQTFKLQDCEGVDAIDEGVDAIDDDDQLEPDADPTPPPMP